MQTFLFHVISARRHNVMQIKIGINDILTQHKINEQIQYVKIQQHHLQRIQNVTKNQKLYIKCLFEWMLIIK
ncbi:unnamed protein product [Paramecium sonneborni]|uniref:Uncharacterized protein n=1 Tax=Paramecium sonneborni TaxID=65129 RepID=A0A8S1L8C7_9CILI|nr:unnamed protein product [Paramecium sonneborni]